MTETKRKKWKKQDWFDLILVLICVPILILGLAVSLSVYQTKQSGGVPTVLGYACFTVVSGSMEPELMTGESFICKTSAKPSSVKEGDIISFYDGKKVVTHKVYSVLTKQENNETKYFFITYGINNKNSNGDYDLDDVVVTEEAYIGIYAGSTNLNGFIGFLTGPWGMLCFVILPLGFLIVTDIISLLSLIKPKKKPALAGVADTATSADCNFVDNSIDCNFVDTNIIDSNFADTATNADCNIIDTNIIDTNIIDSNFIDNNSVDNNADNNKQNSQPYHNIQPGNMPNKNADSASNKKAATANKGDNIKATSNNQSLSKNKSSGKKQKPKKGNRKKRKSRK